MLILKRTLLTYNHIFGVLNCDGHLLTTLERPYLNNQRNISAIPSGNYRLTKHISPKFGRCFWVHDVPNRSSILIHAGNTTNDTRGCILVGQGYSPYGITNSQQALQYLLINAPPETELKIIEV